MDIQPLAEMLEDLLHDASDDGLLACLAEAWLEEDDDAEAVKQEYAQRYRKAVQAVHAQRGEPVFNGLPCAADWPDWLQAEAVAYWSDASGIIFVALMSTPTCLRLVGGGRPHPTRAEAITLAPPKGD